ncbi:hypothetical protein LBMAG56_34020 [Verrucomicrobiota bacterium]|nr:hypothetical protein LBMAG56_34020 [Verrucomicrobiota bacterium]
MADFKFRHPENVPGKFYVDSQCIYCGLCDEFAPMVFRKRDEDESAFVFHQPTTSEELRLAMEAVEGCPYDCIGTDGQ